MLKEQIGFSWTNTRLQVHNIMRRDNVSIQHSEAMQLSKALNASTANFWREMLFLDEMKALVEYAGTFEIDYSVKFVDSMSKDIFDYTHSFNWLPTRSSGTCDR